jgi:hypothetical protein
MVYIYELLDYSIYIGTLPEPKGGKMNDRDKAGEAFSKYWGHNKATAEALERFRSYGFEGFRAGYDAGYAAAMERGKCLWRPAEYSRVWWTECSGEYNERFRHCPNCGGRVWVKEAK